MSHLLALSLGPVQEFIAAARRTSDLTAGSRLLVRAAQAAARAVEQAGGRLIFPADPQRDGPNKVLARLDGPEPAAVAAQAREAARAVLRNEWDRRCGELPADIVAPDLAAAQLDAFLECHAAWWPLDEDYAGARRQVERLLAGRKALRDFAPPPARPGRPKSPLDPSRDCVLAFDPRSLALAEGALRQERLRLKPRETLDAVSLLKRASGDPGVPSTSLMALGSLLPRLRERAPGPLAALEEIARRSGGRVDLGDLFFSERIEPGDLSADEAARAAELRRQALRDAGAATPSPYYAVLAADGDRMGALIEGLPDEERHRRLSEALSGFAARTGAEVARRGGCLVYAGGDDVLALLPATAALECAEALRVAFAGALAPYVPPAPGEGEPRGTLSVGVALVHHLESLQVAVRRAREAEVLAKSGRNALTVALHTRGGAPLAVRRPWADAAGAWRREVAAFRGGLSHGFPYELRALAREAEGTSLAGDRLRAEAERIARRKEGGGLWRAPEDVRAPGDLRDLADRLVIARFLAGLPGVPEEGTDA